MIANSLLVALATIPAFISGAALPQTIPDNWDENSSDIVGGVAAAQGDLPFIVSLAFSGRHWCGGSLVNANTIVTAAHCMEDTSASQWTVRAGSLNRGSGGVTSRVASFKIHPNWNTGVSSNNDVAIIKLSTPIAASSTISYASLAAAGFDPAAGTTLSVFGWGDITEGGNNSPALLRKVDVPVVSRATCRNNYSQSQITTSMFCAGLTQGGKDSCQGDSGGPIVSASKQLVGIVSWGYGCAVANKPGVYASVGALSSFITANL